MGILRALAEPAMMVTLDEAKAHLRVKHTADDAYIERLIKSASQRLDGPDGILGRSVTPTPYVVELADFPVGAQPLRLPMPPTISVEGIQYIDQTGAQLTVDPASYRVTGLGDKRRGAAIYLGSTYTWPTVTSEAWPDRVTITFTAGYSVDYSPGDAVPEPLRQAVLLWIATWYDHRADSVIGTSAAEMPNAAMALIAPYRLYLVC
jgi:uncharacterized phiE125 gp8 family phage protein